MSKPLLEVRGLTKMFPGTVALDDVDLTLRSGQINAIVGHNGSGKSTLVKTLAGVYRPDAGTIETSHGRRGEGLHFIHQDLGLIGDLSVIENLNLVEWRGFAGLRHPRSRREIAEVRDLTAAFGVQIDPLALVRDLAPAERTMVAIARAMSRWPDPHQVLVLDEPTATLQDRDAEAVLAATRRVAELGAGVLYISHRLSEIERIADEVTVMRDGRAVSTMRRGEFTAATLVNLIAGESLEAAATGESHVAPERGRVRLELEAIEATRVHDLSLQVHEGEIVGLSGVTGSGIDDLLGIVFGSKPRTGGTVRIDGAPIAQASPRAMIRTGVGYVPADRHRLGAAMHLSARENLTLPHLGPVTRAWGAIAQRAERREARHWFTRAAIHPDAPERAINSFSGGNQQKVVLARWMRIAPRVLLLEEPTQGIDVGVQDKLYELVRQAASEGAAVLVASSDTKELVELCDRVIVLVDGREVASLSGTDLDEATLVRRTLSSPGEPVPTSVGAAPIAES